MPRIERFEDLEAWQHARRLVADMFFVCTSGELSRNYGLRDQIQRAAVSVMSNIAEGFERINRQEKLHFYNIARASCGELRSLLYVCEDVKYLDASRVGRVRQDCITTGMLISGLMRSFQRSAAKTA